MKISTEAFDLFFLKINTIQEFWQWISRDFLESLKSNETFYNASIRSTYSSFDVYLNDAASILIGYPIIRQLRIKKGKIEIN